MICLAVDIGNTRASLAVMRGQVVVRESSVENSNTSHARLTSAVRKICSGLNVDGSVVSSVVPALTTRWCKCLSQHLGSEPVVVDHRLKLNISIRYPHPGTIGGDRIANACGAVSQFDAPSIVADFGTALTFDIIASDGAYEGGVIAPGLPLMTDYLAEKAALLPQISLRGSCAAVGKTTKAAMKIGARIGYRGMVREVVSYLQEGLGMEGCTLCATGGYAPWALKDSNMPFIFDPHLTLKGMAVIYELNAITR